jgi:hypothetical protein
MPETSLFEYSTAFRNVSAETKKLCEDGHSNRLKRRDPAMYGDHHKCKQVRRTGKVYRQGYALVPSLYRN